MTTWQTTIVFYLALGCAYGLYGVLALYFPKLSAVAFAEHPGLWLVGWTFLALFVGVGLSAYGLWRTRRYSWATVALQIGQLVGFCIGGCKYQFAAGTTLECFYDGHRIEYTINLMTAAFALGLHLPQEFLYVNLMPLLIIYLLQKHFPAERSATTNVPDI